VESDWFKLDKKLRMVICGGSIEKCLLICLYEHIVGL